MKYVYLILILSLPILFSGCKKNKMPFGVLTLETDQITSISAVCSGSVEINPKAPITQVGICWSKSSNPTINENSSIANVLSGTFNIELKNLEVGATYYYRAYAINKNGVSYGDQKNFSTSNDPTNLPKFIRGFNIDIGITQIRLKCNFVQGYNLTIIEKGICWSTNQTANLDTINTNKIILNNNYTKFNELCQNLIPNSQYCFYAYIKTNYGIEYIGKIFNTHDMPAAITFNPNVNYGTIQDNENNTYKTVTIGSQIWMAENLKVTHFNNGDPIPKLSTSGENVILENSSAYTYYDYENGYKDIYGALYNGYVVTDSRGVCPTNWHIANGGDWETLFNDNNVVRLKENSSNYWWVNTQSSNTNSTGFTAIPAGILTNSSFQYLNYSSDWWSSSTNQNSKLMNFYIDVTNSFYKIEDTKEKMFSIRCIKD